MCKTWLKREQVAGSQQPTQKGAVIWQELTKCPNSILLFSLECVCVCVWLCVCMRVHLCSIIQTVHHRETQCVLIRHYVAKQKIRQQKLHRAKNSINARKSVFKAKKTEQSTSWTEWGAAWNQARVWGNLQYQYGFRIWLGMRWWKKMMQEISGLFLTKTVFLLWVSDESGSGCNI